MRCRTGGSIRNRNTAGTCNSYRLPAKTHKPIASVAALTAQPLAALPPYGCGVPFTGSERLACWQSLRHAFCGVRPSSLSLRGGQRPTWQSRSTRPDRGEAVGENVTAFPRLHPKGTSSRFALRAPRRFAPRNDKPLAFTILSTAVPQRKKSGMPENPASPIGSLTYRTVPWRGRGGRPRSGSSAAPRGPRCRWSRRRSCRRSYPHRRAPWQPRSACRASAP